MPAAMATSGAGARGATRANAMRIARVASATASAGSDVSGSASAVRIRFLEKRSFGEVHAEQLRDLVQHDDEADPRLEADEHRRGDEVRHESEPQHRGRHEDPAYEQRQGCARREQRVPIAARHHLRELRADQDRDRRGRAHAEHARGPEQRVDEHRRKHGVEADLDGQARDRRVRHRIRNHDGGRRGARDQLGLQPFPAAGEQPLGDRQQRSGLGAI